MGWRLETSIKPSENTARWGMLVSSLETGLKINDFMQVLVFLSIILIMRFLLTATCQKQFHLNHYEYVFFPFSGVHFSIWSQRSILLHLG